VVPKQSKCIVRRSAGSRDILLGDNLQFAQLAQAAGAPVQVRQGGR
jgi:hypothetical protein